MDPAIYRDRWLRLKDAQTSAESLRSLSRQVAFSFIGEYTQHGRYVGEYLDLLCEMATLGPTAELNHVAAGALFEIIVEKLCDDFEDLPIEMYSRVMCQVISCCRAAPAGADLDHQLADFGMTCAEQLYRRAVDIHTRQYRFDGEKPPRKIVLLSRVTIGADVAILSVVIQHLRQLFPQAELVVVGSSKLTGLFGGNPDVRIRELSYARRGGLFERFASWHATLDILRNETAGLGEDEILVIDPDSRISQLGVLPLTHDDRYLFLNTRDRRLSLTGRCMAEWTDDWMREVFRTGQSFYPALWVPEKVLSDGRRRIEAMRRAGARRVIAMNLGLGQNPRKRVGLDFEKRLVRTLVAAPDTAVVLDSGSGADELERTAVLAADARDAGFAVNEVPFAAMESAALSHGIITVGCDIGQMAALIACSDEYIGYDSACQHIAAAARTPTLTIFAGSNSQGFVRRWSACGDTECRVVHVASTDSGHGPVDEIVARIMQTRAAREDRPRIPVRETTAIPRPGKPAEEPTRRQGPDPAVAQRP